MHSIDSLIVSYLIFIHSSEGKGEKNRKRAQKENFEEKEEKDALDKCTRSIFA